MSNKIIIKNGIVDSFPKGVKVLDKELVFFENGDYVIEYDCCNDLSLDIILEDNVLVKLFIFSKHNDLKVHNHYVLGCKSELLLFQFYDNYSVNENITVDLNGEYSKYYEGFSSISRGNEEYHIIVNHNALYVSSDISNKCIGLDGSRIYMQIDSNLKKGNSDCVMEQESRILTLGDVDACIVPNMYIDEDSVEARHGSIIGGFNDEEIFYLMSRGICYDEAISLLIKGFLFSNLVVDYEKREYIMNSILDMRR